MLCRRPPVLVAERLLAAADNGCKDAPTCRHCPVSCDAYAAPMTPCDPGPAHGSKVSGTGIYHIASDTCRVVWPPQQTTGASDVDRGPAKRPGGLRVKYRTPNPPLAAADHRDWPCKMGASS